MPDGQGAVAGRHRAAGGTASPITFHYKPTAAALFDEGHTLQVQLAAGSTIEIDGNTYQLLQFHFGLRRRAEAALPVGGEHHRLAHAE